MERPLNDVAIPDPEDESREAGAYEEPRGEIEQAIAQLWRQAFHLERVGRNENFFELGGNSLLAMQLMEAFAASLTVQLPVVALFLNPTIRELAQLVTANPQT
jgi:aryl carrier-like protein